jgi:hypothetical protein
MNKNRNIYMKPKIHYMSTIHVNKLIELTQIMACPYSKITFSEPFILNLFCFPYSTLHSHKQEGEKKEDTRSRYISLLLHSFCLY